MLKVGWEGVVAVTGHLVAILSCQMERECRRKGSSEEGGNTASDVAKKTETLSGFVVNHNAASQCR